MRRRGSIESLDFGLGMVYRVEVRDIDLVGLGDIAGFVSDIEAVADSPAEERKKEVEGVGILVLVALDLRLVYSRDEVDEMDYSSSGLVSLKRNAIEIENTAQKQGRKYVAIHDPFLFHPCGPVAQFVLLYLLCHLEFLVDSPYHLFFCLFHLGFSPYLSACPHSNLNLYQR